MQSSDLEYAGFWIRVGASLIDTLLIILVTYPLLTLIYGDEYWVSQELVKGAWDIFLSYLAPAMAVIVFWIYRSATPGKMALKLSIVDAKTGGKPSAGQLVGRYFSYYISLLPFFLGFVWVGIDKRKQGWHDKIAGTLVVRDRVVRDKKVV